MGWVGFFRCVQRLGVEYPADAAEALDLWDEIGRSCGWWWPYEEVCIISDRPITLNTEPRPNAQYGERQLHCNDAAAIEFSDGFKVYAIHGIRVTEQIVLHPETLDAKEQITKEQNAELRRIMLERYGEGNYLEAVGAKLQQEDQYGQLYRASLRGDEDLVMVRVVNKSPEPDGSYSIYWLRVPPTVRSAHEGIAWTFQETPETYHPLQES